MATRKQAYLWLSLVVGSLVGCNASHQQSVRPKSSEDPTAWNSSPISDRSDEADKSVSSGSKSFLKSTHRPGGWSSEASDIERSLGVGR